MVTLTRSDGRTIQLFLPIRSSLYFAGQPLSVGHACQHSGNRHRARLTEEAVRAIRRRAQPCTMADWHALAGEYRVAVNTLREIYRGETWAGV